MDAQFKKTALITGASAGIGREYAIQLGGTHRYNLVLVARREERLKEVQAEIERVWAQQIRTQRSEKGFIKLISMDLLLPTTPTALLALTEGEGMPIDLLVNNAGFGSVGAFHTSDLSRQLEMVRLNTAVALELMHLYLQPMLKRGHGAIVNLCSTASFQPIPSMATYAATKAFLFSLTLAVHAEVRSKNVLVMAHCPGPTESEFHLVAGLEEKISNLPSATANEVVREAIRALERKRNFVVNGRRNRLLATLARALPPTLVTQLVQRVLRKYE